MDDLLQSAGWEQFQQALGHRTHRVDGVLAIELPLPLGQRYLYSPRGGEATSRQLQAASACARKTGAMFWRGECSTPLATRNSQLVTPAVLRRQVEPQHTWRVNLEPSLDAVLAGMHEKHRYNVRLAEKRGVVVRTVSLVPSSRAERSAVERSRQADGAADAGRDFSARGLGRNDDGRGGLGRNDDGGGGLGRNDAAGDFDIFWSLLRDTAARQRIQTHPRAYYETMLATLPDTSLFLAEREGVPLMGAIIAYHGDTATYLHGGSSYEHRAHMAPHLLHWIAMSHAKEAGMRWYDFGGVVPPERSGNLQVSTDGSSDTSRHQEDGGLKTSATPSSWSGMTRFKQGFGGEMVTHPPMYDMVFRSGWYTGMALLARLRP
ncbi:MAG: peptidoglycan bridge formation glycyltransferase FemA/FemB family protein [bacterium]|nr:peptidoglycan bridge formation glycyltransferase FemA/FemB family protein [bacterium]